MWAAAERREVQRAAVRSAVRDALARASRQRGGAWPMLPIAVVPANRRRLARLSARRRREFAAHLDDVIAEALQIQHKRRTTRNRRQLPLPDPPPAGVASGCATCRGHCCRLGGTHAFVDAATVQRLIDQAGTTEPRVLAHAFLRRLPGVSYRSSCVYHARAGCNLPRAMRAEICNRFYCGGLLEGWTALSAPPSTGLAIAAADEGTLLRLTVAKEPGQLQTVRVRRPRSHGGFAAP